MRRRGAMLLIAAAMMLPACGRLGLGTQSCEDHVRDPSAANMLAAQAVPTARYTPCFRSLDLGWDEIDFEVESGRAELSVERGAREFLTAVVTESCEVGDAVPRDSGYPDIAKYEDIEQIAADLRVMIIPAGPAEVAHAAGLYQRWHETELDDRVVHISVDEDTEISIATRVERSLEEHQFVWIIDELDAAENTLEMRSIGGRAWSRLKAEEALDIIEDDAPVALYRGNWFFIFDGGCITYTFDAEGQLAEHVAEDAETNLGFYPAYELPGFGG